jgi:hypothetical protein
MTAEPFAGAKPGNPLYCHQEFLEKLAENRNSPVGKKAALLLQRLWVDERRQSFKATRGDNRGWRRSRLGGNGGSHFYAWWAPKGAPPVVDAPGFGEAPSGSIFLRDIRHHDDHSPLNPQSLSENYMTLGAADVRGDSYVPKPWTEEQDRFAGAKARVRILKGYPGSGKTTALWNAAEASAEKSVLYVTHSRELAAMARDHFDKLASPEIHFRVLPFPRLVRELLGVTAEYESVGASRARFLRETASVPVGTLGPWADQRGALFDEIYAHVVGEAVPVSAGRFEAGMHPWLTPKVYRERRQRTLGSPAASALMGTWETLRKRQTGDIVETLFPELWLAWKAAGKETPLHFLNYDCIAVDEVQDLTPVEALILVRMAAAVRAKGRNVTFLAAGDEAQTVRPSDFEWGWLSDMLHTMLGTPEEFKLARNVRSPRRIALLVNQAWDLYGNIAKQDRPSGGGETEVDEDAYDQIVYCTAAPGAELEELLDTLLEREGLGVVYLGDKPPGWVPKRLHSRVLSTAEAKGLDFSAVCVLDAGAHMMDILEQPDRASKSFDVEPLKKRLAIDQLRVALSRPTERLYWLDVESDYEMVEEVTAFLDVERTGREGLKPVTAEAVLKTLDEELLDVEERIRLCELDARQYLETKPELARARAMQAMRLADSLRSGPDNRTNPHWLSTNLTLAQVVFALAFRDVDLAEEIGESDLFAEAALAALRAGQETTSRLILEYRDAIDDPYQGDLGPFVVAAFLLKSGDDVERWLLDEMSPRASGWAEQIEATCKTRRGVLAARTVASLATMYRLFDFPDQVERTRKVRLETAERLCAAGDFKPALEILTASEAVPPELLARCEEGAGEFGAAARHFLEAGDQKGALRCYRAAGDVEHSLKLLGGDSAAPSLEWLKRVRELMAERPGDFDAVATAAEKDLLEKTLLTVFTPKPAGKKQRK